jgi:D-sedoheptulose 7-phosphate isomerase
VTDFLYPFIEAEERDAPALLADLARSAEAKAAESRALRARTLVDAAGVIADAADAIAARFRRGGRLFAFGNGGSATDAAGVATLFARPPSGRPLPARSLAADEAVLTALGNDVGFDLVFSRQLIAHARSGDIAVALSTSGSSENLMVALAEARRRDVLAVGLAGFDGGRMAVTSDVDHCIVVRADSVHRIQEAQAAVVVALWEGAQRALVGGGVP